MANSSYDDSTIVSMKFLNHLRSKSGMYGFQLANVTGLFQQIKEVLDNSVDEALDKNKVYPIDITFFVSKDKSTYQCLIQDHGRGIPVKKIVDCYTKEFTSGKYEGKYGGSSSGTFGVGSKASAALAKLFLAYTKRDDGFGYVRVEKGVVKESEMSPKRIDKDPKTIGTTVLMQPDPEMFSCIDEMFAKNVKGEEKIGFDIYMEKIPFYNVFKQNVFMTVRLVEGLVKKENLTDPREAWKYLTNPDNFGGKIVYQSDLHSTPRQYVQKKFGLDNPVWELGLLQKESTTEDDPLGYDIDIFLDEKSAKGNNGFIGAVNATPIVHPDSSHIAVLQDVLKDQIVDNLTDVDAKAFFEAKYRIPLSGCVSVTWLGAEFIGQDKSRFENRPFADCYRANLRRVFRKLTEYKGEALWDRLWELIREHFEAEYAKFSKKSLGLTKNNKNLMFDLLRPDSFDDCTLHDNRITEIFITEGDSAAGRVIAERDEDTQALLKLSGKPQNAIRVGEISKLMKNAIFRDLSIILGVSPTDKNLDNMRFARIIIMTDADPDGYHIVALLIGILYKINPRILEEGRVMVTNPPLYSMLLRKGDSKYLRDDKALRDIRIQIYRTLLDIDISVDFGKTSKNLNHSHKFHEKTLADGTKVHSITKNHDEFRSMCEMVDMVGNVVTHEADLLNIEPEILEQLLHVVDYLDEKNVNTDKIVEILDLERVVWDKENRALILIDKSGLEIRVPLARLYTTLRSNILPIYEEFNWRKYSLFVSTKFTSQYVGHPCSFMMLFSIFKTINEGYPVNRFKGLGEMDAQSITETCIDKTKRCFTVIKGIGDVDRLYKMLDTDPEARKKLIQGGLVEES